MAQGHALRCRQAMGLPPQSLFPIEGNQIERRRGSAHGS
jgi:hypothetical protein